MVKSTARHNTPITSWALLAALLFAPMLGWAANAVDAVRYWSSADYSRLTLESPRPISYKLFTLNNPERLVIDLEGVEPSPALRDLAGKIGADDPWIAGLRAGVNRPGVMRLVLDLRGVVKPNVFSLKPEGGNGNRLVLDVYPANAKIPGVNSSQPEPLAEAPANPEVYEPANDSQKEEKSPGTHDKKPQFQITRLITVMIDPGHGGIDPGAHGANGALEKNVTLAIAKRVQAKIDAIPNMRAVLTRNGDYFVPLGERVDKARQINADLFVSIHADAFVNRDARGSSVFTLSEHGATSAAARWLAKSENDADLVGGVNVGVKDKNLARTLIDLSQTATNDDSRRLGRAVLTELSDVNHLHRGRVERAGFAVLKAPDIPSILVETAFISNPEEERRLTDDAYQNKMATAIVDGIQRYFATNPATIRAKLAANS